MSWNSCAFTPVLGMDMNSLFLAGILDNGLDKKNTD